MLLDRIPLGLYANRRSNHIIVVQSGPKWLKVVPMTASKIGMKSIPVAKFRTLDFEPCNPIKLHGAIDVFLNHFLGVEDNAKEALVKLKENRMSESAIEESAAKPKRVRKPKAVSAEAKPKRVRKPTTKPKAARKPKAEKEVQPNGRTRVRVAGNEYSSVFQAFTALDLPINQHKKIRVAVKASKEGESVSFKHDDKTYNFKAIYE